LNSSTQTVKNNLETKNEACEKCLEYESEIKML